MTAQVEQAELADALKLAGHMVKRTPVPILETVKVVAADGAIRLTACDLARQITTSCTASVSEAFTTCVSAKVLADAIAGAPENVIRLTCDNGDVDIKSGHMSARILGWPAKDFPDISTEEDYSEVIVDVADLARVSAFASTSEVKWHLMGVALDRDHLVATDGLCIGTIPAECGDVRSIIPSDAVMTLAKLSAPRIWVGDAMWRAEAEGVSACGRLVDGAFPDWRKIPIGRAAPLCICDLSEIRRAVQSVSIGGTTSLVLSGTEGFLEIEAAQAGLQAIREARTALPCSISEQFSAQIPAATLKRALATLSGENVEIGGAGNLMTFAGGSLRVGISTERFANQQLPDFAHAA